MTKLLLSQVKSGNDVASCEGVFLCYLLAIYHSVGSLIRFYLCLCDKWNMSGRGGKYCVAAGCRNTNAREFSVFLFPKDELLREQWTKQVKRTRAEWAGPTAYSVLCNAHFEPDCFEPGPLLRNQMGIDTRCKLVLKKVSYQ